MNFITVLEGLTVSGKKRKKVIIDLSSIKSNSEASAEEQLDNLKIQDDLELVLQGILDKIEFETSLDNSGIGNYEFGSYHEFDAGEDFLIIEDEDTKVHAVIILGEVSSIAARVILRNACLIKRTISSSKREDITLEISFSPSMSYEGKGFLAYKIAVEGG